MLAMKTEVYHSLEILICDPLRCLMNHPRLIVDNQMEEFISLRRMNLINVPVYVCVYLLLKQR